MYIVCALLRNAITCLYGNQTSEFFDLEPPTLEEYFQSSDLKANKINIENIYSSKYVYL